MHETISPIIAEFTMKDTHTGQVQSTIEQVTTKRQLDGIEMAAIDTPLFRHGDTKISKEEAESIVEELEAQRENV